MDFLCRADEDAIRQRVRSMIKICGAGGGYALGMGNSLSSYIPLDKYIFMLNEALEVVWY